MDTKFDKEKVIRLYSTISELRGYRSIYDVTKDEITFFKSYCLIRNKFNNICSSNKEIDWNEILKEQIKLIMSHSHKFTNIKLTLILMHCKESYNKFLSEEEFIKLCDEIYKNRFKF